MKKSLLAIAAMTAFAGAAQAQSSVTVYGTIDVGVMGSTGGSNLNSTPFAVSSGVAGGNQNTGSGGSYVKNGYAFGGMASGQSLSNIGFKGSEDLGGGTKAIFDLDTVFNPMTGSIGNTGLPGQTKTTASVSGDTALQGQLFNNKAYAGLSNDKYGTLTIGRQYNLMLDNIGGYNPVNAVMFSPIAYAGSYGGGGLTDDSRVDQAIKYKQTINGVNIAAIYAPGGVAGSATAGTTTGAQIGYEKATWGVQAIASHTTDATSLNYYVTTAAPTAGVPNTVAVTLQNTTAYQLTAKWNPVSSFWLKAGYERELIGTPSNFQNFSGLSQLPSGYVVGSLTSATANKTLNVTWLGANYDFTPAIKGSVGYYYVGIPAYGAGTGLAGANGGSSGTQTYASAMVEYYLSKRTNLYAAYMAVNTTGGQNLTNAGSGFSGTTTAVSATQNYGIGMRHTF